MRLPAGLRLARARRADQVVEIQHRDDSSIGDTDGLLRRIPLQPAQVIWDSNRGCRRPTSAAFCDHPNGTPMSVSIQSLILQAGLRYPHLQGNDGDFPNAEHGFARFFPTDELVGPGVDGRSDMDGIHGGKSVTTGHIFSAVEGDQIPGGVVGGVLKDGPVKIPLTFLLVKNRLRHDFQPQGVACQQCARGIAEHIDGTLTRRGIAAPSSDEDVGVDIGPFFMHPSHPRGAYGLPH